MINLERFADSGITRDFGKIGGDQFVEGLWEAAFVVPAIAFDRNSCPGTAEASYYGGLLFYYLVHRMEHRADHRETTEPTGQTAVNLAVNVSSNPKGVRVAVRGGPGQPGHHFEEKPLIASPYIENSVSCDLGSSLRSDSFTLSLSSPVFT